MNAVADRCKKCERELKAHEIIGNGFVVEDGSVCDNCRRATPPRDWWTRRAMRGEA